ncbi:hypothetical protein BZA05DRAFT_392692 [Tricharina praecox]|uniref:uncharacterized protein n=1 Tax=Tricharina praecox TaxID=43433 RepID=UPI00222080A3|nr:uncharacterized protein BZA05DRAFT_392692 [Tricharina praecox]KAI5854829.1 hypothetical protein BZA05DRAFT_392692 [Tricharina praecox]
MPRNKALSALEAQVISSPPLPALPVSTTYTTTMESAGAIDSRYPATTKRAAGYIKDVPTDAMVVGFADKLLITVTQAGRLAQWFHVPLDSAHRVIAEETAEGEEDQDDSLLPLSHLTPTTLLGGTVPEREATGQLIAVQLASIITTRNKDEGRMVVCGLGLRSAELDQQGFLELVELVGRCL